MQIRTGIAPAAPRSEPWRHDTVVADVRGLDDGADGECRVAWTTDLDAPSGVPAVSVRDGIVYAYVKRHSWLGVDAWYLAALDLETGRLLWAERTGLGVLRDNHHGEITLGPGRSAYVPVLGGLVRVRDRD